MTETFAQPLTKINHVHTYLQTNIEGQLFSQRSPALKLPTNVTIAHSIQSVHYCANAFKRFFLDEQER